MKLLDYLFSEKQHVEIPAQPNLESAWLSSNFIFRWLTRLHDWGVHAEEYKRLKGSDEDRIFALYKKLLAKYKKEPLVLQSLYYELAMMRAELGHGAKEYLKLAQQSVLQHYRKSRTVSGVALQNAGRDACSSCRKLDGWLLTLSQAEKKKLLPNPRCAKKHGKAVFCRCTYEPVMEKR